MKIFGTIVLWLVSLGVLAATAILALVAYSFVHISAYKETWLFFLPVAIVLLLGLWLNPLVRAGLKQRGRHGSLWVVSIGLLCLCGASGFGAKFAMEQNPLYKLDEAKSLSYTDKNAAAAIYSDLCSQKVGAACTEAGMATDDGWNVKHDPNNSARIYFVKACDDDNAAGCAMLFVNIGDEPGNLGEVRQSANAARKACLLSDAKYFKPGFNDMVVNICTLAGTRAVDGYTYQGTVIVEKDRDLGVSMLNKACKASDKEACEKLKTAR